MSLEQSPSASPMWPRYHTYARIAVCLLLVPLVMTGVVLVAEARLDFVATTIIVMCCLYIDADTVKRAVRAKPNRAR